MSSVRKLDPVLVARSNQQRATALEVHLRTRCETMRIHTDLSGAHMIFPKESGLAIRVYYPPDYERLSEIQDTDGLLEFSWRFRWAVTFFIIPDHTLLGNRFVRQCTQLADAECPANRQPLRLVLVPDLEQLMDNLLFFMETIGPSRTTMRSNFFQKVHTEDFWNVQAPEAAVRAISRLKSTFRNLSEQLAIPLGETDILLNMFGGLEVLVYAECVELDSVPVDNRTKRMVMEIFQGGVDDDGLGRILEETAQEMEQVNSLPFFEETVPQEIVTIQGANGCGVGHGGGVNDAHVLVGDATQIPQSHMPPNVVEIPQRGAGAPHGMGASPSLIGVLPYNQPRVPLAQHHSGVASQHSSHQYTVPYAHTQPHHQHSSAMIFKNPKIQSHTPEHSFHPHPVPTTQSLMYHQQPVTQLRPPVRQAHHYAHGPPPLAAGSHQGSVYNTPIPYNDRLNTGNQAMQPRRSLGMDQPHYM